MTKSKPNMLRKFFAGLLCAALLLSFLPAPAHAVTQQEVDALAAERDALRQKRKAVQDEIDALRAQQNSILELKLVLDERAEYNKQEMLLNEQEITLYDQMIEDKAKDVEAAKALEDEQLERYRTRVRAMEENGGYNILALILNTTDLGELLTSMDDIGEIMQSDRELEDNYIAAREHTEAVKAEYEAYKAELEVKQDELRAVQAQLQQEIDEAVAYVAQIEQQIAENSAVAEQFRAEEAAVQEALNQKIAELEAERKRREEEERRRKEAEERAKQQQGGGGGSTGGSTGGGTVVATGSWTWPCPGHTYITSRAGNRFHPILNEWRYHAGIDIAANNGDAVVAADSGTVIACGVSGGYGNRILIDHGNGYYTLYAHLSAYSVGLNDSVSKGQRIGSVGSTGWATGPHLHFELRNGNGAIANVEGVCGFGGLTYAPDAGE